MTRKFVFKPLGSYLLVDPIITTLGIEERAARVENPLSPTGRGIEIVLEQENVPKPTQGRVVALGPDPLLHEQVKVGDIVFFNWASGHDTTLEGKVFRQLLLSELTGVMQEEDLTPSSPHPDESTVVDQPSPVPVLDKP